MEESDWSMVLPFLKLMSSIHPGVCRVPTIDFSVSLASIDALQSGVKQVALLAIPAFAAVGPDDLKLSRVSGGITNTLYRVEFSGISILVRVFGENTEKVIDRERERFVIESLSTFGIGTPILTWFTNGRVETFLDSVALRADEMNFANYVPLIGEVVAKFHACELSLDKKPALFQTMYKYLDLINGLDWSDELRSELNFPWLLEQVRCCEKNVLNLTTDVVFCHNDLLSGNILYEQTRGMFLIDFEYSSYNYRVFDIANHFCECCGFACDWNEFPSLSQQTSWLEAYTASLGLKELVPEILAQVPVFTLCSHLFWGIWALFQSQHAKIDFDFLAYSHLRIAGYKLMSSESWKVE